MARIAIIPGDGIGLEVTREAVRVLERSSIRYGFPLELTHWEMGADRYLDEGVTITDEEFHSLAHEHDAILLGALGDPRVPGNEHARDILLGLRFRLDLYVNHRPAVLHDPRLSPLKGMEGRGMAVDIFRENTEGLYVNLGGSFKVGTPDEVAIQEDLNTWKGVERIVRAAFDFARSHARGRVTLVDKANAMPAAGRLWRRVFREVGAEFPELETDAMYVDAMAMDLVRCPERYDVVVTGNLFGDIPSDLASTPRKFTTVALVVRQIGQGNAADEVEEALREAIRGGVTTADLGGDAGTREVGEWIADHLGRRDEVAS